MTGEGVKEQSPESVDAFPSSNSDEFADQQVSVVNDAAVLKFPESHKLNIFQNLVNCCGWRLLVVVSICVHWCKGFGRCQLLISQQYLLQSPWNVSGPQMDIYAIITELPWMMKPLIAICSDLYPVFGYRKLPYMVVTLLLAVCGGVLAFSMHPSMTNYVEIPLIGMFLLSFGWMTCDVLLEGLYARKIADNTNGSVGPDLIAFLSLGQNICCLISAVISGFVISNMDGVLGLSGAQWNVSICLFPTIGLLVVVGSNYIGESAMPMDQVKKTRKAIFLTQKLIVGLSIAIGIVGLIYVCIGLFWFKGAIPNLVFAFGALGLMNILYWYYLSPGVSAIVLFVGICCLSNTSIKGPAHYFNTDDMQQYPEGPHFEPWFYVTICGVIAAGGGVFASCLFAMSKAVKFRSIFIAICFCNMVLSLPNCVFYSRCNVNLGISDYLFLGSDTAIQSIILNLFYMISILLLTRVCPENVESSTFAVLTSVLNFALATSVSLSALICVQLEISPNGSLNESKKFENLWIANIIMSVLKITPVGFAFLIPNCVITDKQVCCENRIIKELSSPNSNQITTYNTVYSNDSQRNSLT